MPEHSAIADPNIHEPKGVAAASAGQVYKADGAGSGSWGDVLPTQTGHSGKSLKTDGSSASWSSDNRVLARASVNVTAGTVSNAVNVASVSGSTNITVTFTTALANANYVVLATITDFGSTSDSIIINYSKGTTTVTFRTYRGATGAATAVDAFDFVIFG